MCYYGPHPEWGSFASGFILAGMIYASAHLSGAHFNPAVSIAVFLRGKMNLNTVPLYIMAQIAGGAMGAVITVLITGTKTINSLQLANTSLESMLAEFLGVFVITYVVLNVATSKNTHGNDYYGLAIGLTVIACSITFSFISGAAHNPAVSLAMCISKVSSFSNLWIYWIGEILGGVLASVLFLFLNGKD